MSSFFSQEFDFFFGRNQSPSPITAANSDAAAAKRYLKELLAEREKLEPVMQMLPICRRLLDQEIMKASRKINLNKLGFGDDHNMASSNPDGGNNLICNMHHQPSAAPQDDNMAVDSPHSTFPQPTSSSSTVVKSLRLDIPVATYPKFNFVGRLLGPQGNSLKRIEDYTNCRVFIRGKGSMKNAREEGSLKGKKGYEHLNEPLHVLIKANLPASIVDARLTQAKEIIEELLKPVEASQDLYKKEQLRELEMIKYGDRRSL